MPARLSDWTLLALWQPARMIGSGGGLKLGVCWSKESKKKWVMWDEVPLLWFRWRCPELEKRWCWTF